MIEKAADGVWTAGREKVSSHWKTGFQPQRTQRAQRAWESLRPLCSLRPKKELDQATPRVAPPSKGNGAENLGGAIFNRALEKGAAP